MHAFHCRSTGLPACVGRAPFRRALCSEGVTAPFKHLVSGPMLPSQGSARGEVLWLCRSSLTSRMLMLKQQWTEREHENHAPGEGVLVPTRPLATAVLPVFSHSRTILPYFCVTCPGGPAPARRPPPAVLSVRLALFLCRSCRLHPRLRLPPLIFMRSPSGRLSQRIPPDSNLASHQGYLSKSKFSRGVKSKDWGA